MANCPKRKKNLKITYYKFNNETKHTKTKSQNHERFTNLKFHKKMISIINLNNEINMKKISQFILKHYNNPNEGLPSTGLLAIVDSHSN